MTALKLRPLQFLLSELLSLLVLVGLILAVCRQGPEACIGLAAVAIPLCGPSLILWGSIFEHRRMETLGVGITLCAPVLLFAAAMLPAVL